MNIIIDLHEQHLLIHLYIFKHYRISGVYQLLFNFRSVKKFTFLHTRKRFSCRKRQGYILSAPLPIRFKTLVNSRTMAVVAIFFDCLGVVTAAPYILGYEDIHVL